MRVGTARIVSGAVKRGKSLSEYFLSLLSLLLTRAHSYRARVGGLLSVIELLVGRYPRVREPLISDKRWTLGLWTVFILNKVLFIATGPWGIVKSVMGLKLKRKCYKDQIRS